MLPQADIPPAVVALQPPSLPSSSDRQHSGKMRPDNNLQSSENRRSAPSPPTKQGRYQPQKSPPNRSLGKGRFSREGSVQEFDVSPLPSPTGFAAAMKADSGSGKRNAKAHSAEDATAESDRAAASAAAAAADGAAGSFARRPSLSLIAKLKESSEKMLHVHVHNPFSKRHLSSFLRVADLLGHMEEDDDHDDHHNGVHDGRGSREDEETGETETHYSDASSSASASSSSAYPNYHHAAIDPPPGVDVDSKERWIALDDGGGNHAPVAPRAVRALARSGLASCLDREMWAPDKATGKLLASQPASTTSAPSWSACVWQHHGRVEVPPKQQDAVLVWTGSFKHGLYGSDLPAVRAAGVVDAPAKELLDMLVDSSRVKEYNKLSLGRTDELVLQGDYADGPFGGVTKVMKSKSRPPLLRKTLLFTSILHARDLSDGSGYNIVTRAVTMASDADRQGAEENVLTSEILMGVTVIKRIEGDDGRCLVITVNHIRSPMLPTMIAKRIGLQAAVSFVHDLRAAAKALK